MSEITRDLIDSGELHGVDGDALRNRGSDDDLSTSVAEETDSIDVDDVSRDDDVAVESDVQIDNVIGPSLTNLLEHDIELQDTKHIRQSPYRLSPEKANSVRQEIKYMLDNDLIVPSENDWCSPIVLVKKEDG
ncbi:uncharacterized protein [Palaemon carinicauda]|uniref:uncharacterized protein n=1 Tax=Palaemon carinicauda TaxID=392227 RepID=UPI0035B5FEE2